MKKGRKKYLLNVSGFGGKVDDALMISSPTYQSRVKLIYLQVNIYNLIPVHVSWTGPGKLVLNEKYLLSYLF